MSTKTVSSESESSVEQESAFDKLRELDNRSHGSWVECKCSKVEETTEYGKDAVTYKFESIPTGRTEERTFEVPDSPKDSDIQQFLDYLDYTLSNAKLLEGDDFWMDTESGDVRAEVPSWWERASLSLRSWFVRMFSFMSKGREVGGDFGIGIAFFVGLFAPLLGWLVVFCWKGDEGDYGAVGAIGPWIIIVLTYLFVL